MFNISSCLLDKGDDLLKITKATFIISDWSTLGVQLGLPRSSVEKLEIENTEIVDLQQKILQQWLDTGSASWAKLVKALTSEVVDKAVLATRIAKDHLSKLRL